MGGHGLVRRMDRQEEVLIWCRKCSGYVIKMGLKLKNTGGSWNENEIRFWKRQIPTKEARNWNLERQRRITRKEEDCGLGPKTKCWKIEVHFPKKMEINRGNAQLCTKKNSLAIGQGKMWKAQKKGGRI